MAGKHKKTIQEPLVAQNEVQGKSAPTPTMEDANEELFKMRQAQSLEGAVNGMAVGRQPVGKEQVQKATEILRKYKEGKANLEKKIIENEQWYKMRHWEQMRDKQDDVQPSSAWLFNCIANKHADAMDNFPSPNVLPREEGDKGEAEMLSSIIPVILDQCDFEKTYSDVWNYKLKSGTGVYGVYWDKNKHNGLGDISIKKIDIINLFWQSGITNIQDSRNVFNVELVDNDLLINQYPQLSGTLGQGTIDLSKYVYDDAVETTEKSAVVDWYYKKQSNGKTILHYCKYVNDTVLFATENSTEPMLDEAGNVVKPPMAETGLYDHGKYPFIFDVLFQIEGTPAGFGYIDVGKDNQAYIDRINQAIMKNTLVNAKPRYLSRLDGGINEKEFADTTIDIVHYTGNIDDILPINAGSLDVTCLNVLNSKIDELKETTGNRDVSQGGTTGGVTSASGLAAQMEAGSKLSRDANKQAYRAYREMIEMVIELIRQFYTIERKFRIMGENGTERFVAYSNANIQPQGQGMDMGMDMGYRVPMFDIEITAQKQSPYSKMSQNDLALQFYQAGFFNPQLADQALACLDMMDFDRKHFVMQKITQNGTMFQQMMMMQQQMLAMAQQLDKLTGTNMAQAMMQGGGQPPMPQGDSTAKTAETTEVLGGDGGKESSITKNARKRVAESTSPT